MSKYWLLLLLAVFVAASVFSVTASAEEEIASLGEQEKSATPLDIELPEEPEETDVPVTGTDASVIDPERTPGDINGDGKVTIADVVRLAEYVNARGRGVEAVEDSTDVNNDGKVTISDVVLLAEYVNARGQGVVIH